MTDFGHLISHPNIICRPVPAFYGELRSKHGAKGKPSLPNPDKPSVGGQAGKGPKVSPASGGIPKVKELRDLLYKDCFHADHVLLNCLPKV